jgi:phosphocarrier protein HPr
MVTHVTATLGGNISGDGGRPAGSPTRADAVTDAQDVIAGAHDVIAEAPGYGRVGPHRRRARGVLMAQRKVVVASSVGLHARPAAIFTKAAAGSGIKVTIRKGDGDPVPASSILSVLTLNVAHGDEVTLEADGDGADAVLDGLVELLATDHDA